MAKAEKKTGKLALAVTVVAALVVAGFIARPSLLATARAAGSTATLEAGTDATANKGTRVSTQVLRIYATASPQGDVIRYVQKLADADKTGLHIKLTTSGGSGALDSYELLASGDTDVVFTGHEPYVKAWKRAHPTLDNFTGKATVLVNAFGLYSKKTRDPKALPDGATILVPNEQTNLPRALFILQDLGLIKLNVARLDSSPAAIDVNEKSITANPHHLKLLPTDTVLRAKALADADASFINGDVALSNNVDPAEVLARESATSNPYANLIYVRNTMVSDDRVNLLAHYLTGPDVKKFINDNYHGFVIADQKVLR